MVLGEAHCDPGVFLQKAIFYEMIIRKFPSCIICYYDHWSASSIIYNLSRWQEPFAHGPAATVSRSALWFCNLLLYSLLKKTGVLLDLKK